MDVHILAGDLEACKRLHLRDTELAQTSCMGGPLLCHAIHFAARHSQPHIVEWLLTSIEVDVLDTNSSYGFTPLHHAVLIESHFDDATFGPRTGPNVEQQRLKVVKMILDHNPAACLVKTYYDKYPLCTAVEGSTEEVVLTMLSYDPRQLDYCGMQLRQIPPARLTTRNHFSRNEMILRALDRSFFQGDPRAKDLEEEEVLKIRYRVYFATSLTLRLLRRGRFRCNCICSR